MRAFRQNPGDCQLVFSDMCLARTLLEALHIVRQLVIFPMTEAFVLMTLATCS